jgi:nucleotide-binding universal stress UspA family protein
MKTIVVPLDGSLLAEEALPTAISLARRIGAKLELILVNEARPGDGLERWPWAVSSAATHADYLGKQAARLAESTGLVVEHAVAKGRSAEEICRRADERAVALIVMTSRCRTGIARVLGGSVADAVVRHARQPVLLLRGPSSSRLIRRGALRLERVLVAFDGSFEAAAALEATLALVDPGVTEIHIVGVVPPARRSAYRAARRGRVDRDATARMADGENATLEALAAAVAMRTTCDVYPHTHVNDDIAHGILEVARGFNISMIAMGTRGRGGSRLFVGSVTERVLQNARCPMLLVHAPRADSESTSHRRKEA